MRSHGEVDFLTAVHHGALCQQQMCRILEITAGPVLDALTARCWEAEVQAQQLREVVASREQAEAKMQAIGVLLPLHQLCTSQQVPHASFIMSVLFSIMLKLCATSFQPPAFSIAEPRLT